jgi:hypothetical protein
VATTKRYSLSYSIPDHLGRSSGEEGCAHVAVAPSPEGRCQLTRSMQHHLPSIFSLNVVFVTQGRRAKLSAKQRIGMWRWKAGQSLQEIGRAFGKDHVSIQFMSSQHGGIAPRRIGARCSCLHWQNARTSHEESLQVGRFARSPRVGAGGVDG